MLNSICKWLQPGILPAGSRVLLKLFTHAQEVYQNLLRNLDQEMDYNELFMTANGDPQIFTYFVISLWCKFTYIG